MKLPPHTSHLLQPLDLAVFKSFKTAWDEELVSWQRKNQGVKLPKKIFSEKVRKVWNNLRPEIIQNGFKKAGIFPFNSTVIPKEKYHPEALKRWEKENDREVNEDTETEGITNEDDNLEADQVERDEVQASQRVIPNEEVNLEATQDERDELEAGPSNVSFEELLLETFDKMLQAI